MSSSQQDQAPPRTPKRRGRAAQRRPEGDLLERDGMINSEELAAYLDVPVSTLDMWAHKGGGPVFHKVGVHRRYQPADVKGWLAERRVAVTVKPDAA